MKVVVTGGAGFIGSNLSRALLDAGHHVVAIDNLSTGRPEFVTELPGSGKWELVEIDLLEDSASLADVFMDRDVVIHLAANADVRFGLDHPRRDLEQNVIVTHNVLEGVRAARVPELVFSSTGSVYGEAAVIPTPEDAPFPVQTSLYGASKLAAEGLIAAYCEGYGLNATVYRFVSILGRNYTHGHVIDFVAQLLKNPRELHLLGDGTQCKSYLEVSDCVAAIVGRLGTAAGYDVFNLGVDDHCTVDQSAGWISQRMGLAPERTYGGGSRGWVGDNPFILLDTAKIRATGWQPVHSIRGAVEATVDFLLDNRWLFDAPHDGE